MNNHNFSKKDKSLNPNLFKYFFTYDYMKFQQFMKTVSQGYDNGNSKHNRKYNTFTKRRRYRNHKPEGKINTHNMTLLHLFDIKSDLTQIKQMHRSTDEQIGVLKKDNICEKSKHFCINNFTFEIIQSKNSNDQIHDYFSFKIKAEMSLSSSVNDLKNLQTGERHSMGSNYKKSKCHSPDRLLSHKFFEDTEHFRNSNLMSVKTFLHNNETASNPFCMTNKSDSEIYPIDKYKLSNLNKDNTFEKIFQSNERKLDFEKTSEMNDLSEVAKNLEENKNMNNCNVADQTENSFIKENDDMSISITNYSEREIESGKKRRESNLQNLHVSEEEGNTSNIFISSEKKKPPLKKMNTDITYTSQTMSDNNDTVSMTSSKFNVECSQEKFKRVRGFNFKNNINTKKYTKPLFNAKAKSDDKGVENESKILVSSANGNISSKLNESCSQNGFSINKSSNLEEKVKVKKFNFNNNINIKKFISSSNSASGNHQVHKEREKQYAVEIEETEHDPVMLSNINIKK